MSADTDLTTISVPARNAVSSSRVGEIERDRLESAAFGTRDPDLRHLLCARWRSVVAFLSESPRDDAAVVYGERVT